MSEFNIVVQARNEDEDDATDKQLKFIKQLFITIGNEPMKFKSGDLGKWQASTLIDNLIEIRDNQEETIEIEEHEQKQITLLLGLGILLIPYIFSWFLLRKGYSNTSKIIAFTWLAFSIYAILSRQ